MRNATTNESATQWEEISPQLDAAMMKLSETDRSAVAMRCLQERSFAEVGASLGVSEDTARKRVDRAIGKLRKLLIRKGVTTPQVLGAILAARGAQAAPTALRNMLAGAASQGAWSGNVVAIGEGASRALAVVKIKLLAAAVFAIAVVGVILPMALHMKEMPARAAVDAAPAATSNANQAKINDSAPANNAATPATMPDNAITAEMPAFAKAALPQATYFADPARTVFPGGLLNEIDANGKLVGWGDLRAMDTGNASVVDDSAKNLAVNAWQLNSADPAQVVMVRALVPIHDDGNKIAVMARLIGQNMQFTAQKDSWAGVGFSFVDKDQKQVGDSVLLQVSDTKQYHQPMMATLQPPHEATAVLVTVAISKASGKLTAGNIVVMPVDDAKDPSPAQVVALHRAIKTANVATVRKMIAADKRLLECRNMEQTGATPLEIAAQYDEADMVKAFLDMGADPKARDMTIMWSAADTAAVHGSARALEVLLTQTDADLDEVAYYVDAGQKNPPGGAMGGRNYAACSALLEKARALKSPPASQP